MTPAPFHAEIADSAPGAEAYWLAASDGVRLRAVVWAGGSRGTAVVFPGRTEFAEKYGRVAAQLVARGLAVAMIDWRGQGLSDRPPGNAMRGHVEDFRDYQRDVAALLGLVERLEMPGPRYLFAHSMGGCIGLRTLLERVNHAETASALVAERAFLAALDGSCRTPIGGHATVESGRIELRGLIAKPDGSEVHQCVHTGPVSDAAAVGRAAGSELKQRAGAVFFRQPPSAQAEHGTGGVP